MRAKLELLEILSLVGETFRLPLHGSGTRKQLSRRTDKSASK
jgi:hypothetical protein